MTIRVLIVDDFEDWRRTVRQMLQERPELQVICEVADGLEAVQKADELKPDLILLDIGLPKLNGIEAARQIRQLSPHSKIIFLSQDNSLDPDELALSTGAQAYVHKTDVRSDLLPAIEAVLRGERFVSGSLKVYKFTDTPGANAPHRHEVQFYSDDTIFLDSFTTFIGAALEAGNAVIVVATKSHRDSFLPRLRASGLDIAAAIAEGRYISMDAADTIATFMVNDLIDEVRFSKAVRDLIVSTAKAAKGDRRRVAACGECAHLLWAQGKVEAAIRDEQLWDEIAKTCDVDILCGYPMSSFHREEDSHIFQRICAEHSAVYSR